MQCNSLSQTLKKEAIDRGLCSEWASKWSDSLSQQELIDRYVSGIDFIIQQGEWPTNDFIKTNFDRDLLHKNLIYVDEHIDLKEAPNGVYILNGECSGTLWFNSWAAATVYVRHNSNVTIIADDFSKVFVHVYDEANAEVVELDEAVVKVYDRR